MAIIKVDSTAGLHELMGLAKPEHPLLTIIDLAETACTDAAVNTKIVPDFYSVSLKTKVISPILYGRDYYDFQEGTLFAMEPGQTLEFQQAYDYGDVEGWVLYFHPSLLERHPLQKSIKGYGFFSYDVREALHVSDNEKQALTGISEKIATEYQRPIDDFSRDILLANISLLLVYVDRYFNRQFITRKHRNQEVVTQLRQLLESYFSSTLPSEQGLPSVQYIANQFHYSAKYLGDLLRKETGSSTQELIHDYIIEAAKYKLLNSNDSVSNISFELGFEYPQYFSRIFKKKTGLSPQGFRKPH